MPTPSKPISKRSPFDRPQTIPVRVEQTIAEISIGDGDKPAIVAALEAVGNHQARHDENGLYFFGATRISITHTRDGDAPGLTEWLRANHPYVLDEYDEKT